VDDEAESRDRNEANSPRYWPATGGAAGYEALLARCWDVLHAIKSNMNVIDSTASHYDPARFILELGAAYRASGRQRPIVDTFGIPTRNRRRKTRG
jgi:hypothetical protein